MVLNRRRFYEKKKVDNIEEKYLKQEINDLNKLQEKLDIMLSLANRQFNPYDDKLADEREVSIILGLKFEINDLFIKEIYSLKRKIEDLRKEKNKNERK